MEENNRDLKAPYYVYMLRCADGTVYTGITTDPTRRFGEHSGENGRGAKYTRSHGAARLEAVWLAGGRSTASKLEYRIKRLTRPDKEKLISGESIPGELFPELESVFPRADEPGTGQISTALD